MFNWKRDGLFLWDSTDLGEAGNLISMGMPLQSGFYNTD